MSKNNYDLELYAGPCSITPENTEEIIAETSKITTPDGKLAIYGTRVVGLKSRTALDYKNDGMGIDGEVMKEIIKNGVEASKHLKIPSVELAEKIAKETDLVVSAEIMIPHLQLPFWEAKKTLKGRVMVWNPAVEQLGWNLLELADFARRNDWHVGIKHAKFLGKDTLEEANHPDFKGETTLEKVLLGLTTYVGDIDGDLIIIHRGVDVPGRGEYRNAMIHHIMARVKKKVPHGKIFFDPTHTIGPAMRHTIVDEVIKAAKLKVGDEYLYDGFIMEAGSSSPVDFGEHLSLDELRELVNVLSEFRKIRSPK